MSGGRSRALMRCMRFKGCCRMFCPGGGRVWRSGCSWLRCLLRTSGGSGGWSSLGLDLPFWILHRLNWLALFWVCQNFRNSLKRIPNKQACQRYFLSFLRLHSTSFIPDFLFDYYLLNFRNFFRTGNDFFRVYSQLERWNTVIQLSPRHLPSHSITLVLSRILYEPFLGA